MGQRRRSQHVRNESAYLPIAAGEQTSRLVSFVPQPGIRDHRRSAAKTGWQIPDARHNPSAAGTRLESREFSGLGNIRPEQLFSPIMPSGCPAAPFDRASNFLLGEQP
jgi:hypothetical protein